MVAEHDSRREAASALRGRGLDPRLLDAVALDDRGVQRTVAALAAADGRDGSPALWAGVVAVALGLHRALHAVAFAGRPDPPPLSGRALLDEMFVTPLERLPDARAGLLVAEARRGALALQAPTDLHRELAATCAGGADPSAWREAVVAWAAHRDAGAAAAELQEWGLPAFAVGRPQPPQPQPQSPQPQQPQPQSQLSPPQLPQLPPQPRDARARLCEVDAEQPLSGTRVIELGGLWAAPYAAQLLRRLGAEVVKVEAPTRLDGARAGSPAHFHALNAGKRIARLDLRRAPERAELLALLRSRRSGRSEPARAQRSDAPHTVVVENFTDRVLGNLGLAPELLLAHGAALVRLPASRVRPDLRGLGSSIELAGGLGRRDRHGRLTCAAIPFTDALAGACAALCAVVALRGGARLHVVGQLEDVARRATPDAAPPR